MAAKNVMKYDRRTPFWLGGLVVGCGGLHGHMLTHKHICINKVLPNKPTFHYVIVVVLMLLCIIGLGEYKGLLPTCFFLSMA